MTLQEAMIAEAMAANVAIISARDELERGHKVPLCDLDAATIAALWLALELASKGMSKEALKRMVFGEDGEK